MVSALSIVESCLLLLAGSGCGVGGEEICEQSIEFCIY